MTRGDAWTRALLMLMSVVAGSVAALAFLDAFLALGPEDEVPASYILVPSGIAVLGIVMACVGGAPARWVCAIVGALVAFVSLAAFAEMPLDQWLESRWNAATAAVLAAATCLGFAAIAVACRVAIVERRPR